MKYILLPVLLTSIISQAHATIIRTNCPDASNYSFNSDGSINTRSVPPDFSIAQDTTTNFSTKEGSQTHFDSVSFDFGISNNRYITNDIACKYKITYQQYSDSFIISVKDSSKDGRYSSGLPIPPWTTNPKDGSNHTSCTSSASECVIVYQK